LTFYLKYQKREQAIAFRTEEQRLAVAFVTILTQPR